MILKFKAILN